METKYLTPNAALAELSRRARGYRIEYPLTQKQLAEKAGVSLRSVQRFENGGDIQMTTFFRILEALGLREHIFTLIPDVEDRPSAYLPQHKRRQRVRVTQERKESNEPFQWGDEK